MTSSTEASTSNPVDTDQQNVANTADGSVAVDDLGSPEAFLAAVDATIKYFNDGDIVLVRAEPPCGVWRPPWLQRRRRWIRRGRGR